MLKESGFNDIEVVDREGDYLHSWSNSIFRHNGNLLHIESKMEYYRMAEHFLGTHKFLSIRDKIVWLHHQNGLTSKAIEHKLKKHRIKCSNSTVLKVIKDLSKIMLEEMRDSHYE